MSQSLLSEVFISDYAGADRKKIFMEGSQSLLSEVFISDIQRLGQIMAELQQCLNPF